MSKLSIDYAGQQILGDRDRQEDAFEFRIEPRSGLRLAGTLADGIGGLLSGDIAAEVAVSTFVDTMVCADIVPDEESLLNAVEMANAALLEIYEESDMSGCTLVGFVVANDKLRWVSVGDSGLWLFRDNELKRLNEDHSVGALLKKELEAGNLTESEWRTHPQRNVLTSYLGSETIERIDRGHLLLESGDRIIAGSDGLEPLLEDGQLAALLSEEGSGDASAACDAILARLESLDVEHQDNATVVVVKIL